MLIFRRPQQQAPKAHVKSGCPFYIGKAQYVYWRHTQLIIDVIDGHGGTF